MVTPGPLPEAAPLPPWVPTPPAPPPPPREPLDPAFFKLVHPEGVVATVPVPPPVPPDAPPPPEPPVAPLIAFVELPRRPPPPPPPAADIDPKLVVEPLPPLVQLASGPALVSEPCGAPVAPPPPTETTVTAPGVVAIVDVPLTTPLESEVVPETKTSPAPPPPPRLPNPPPPPPPTTATSIAVTPDGVVQLHVVRDVKVRIVYPPEEVLDGEQVGLLTTTNENVAVEVPEVFVAVIVIERDAKVPVGVPEISPVDVLKLKPTAVNAVESAEGIEYEAAGPPELVMV